MDLDRRRMVETASSPAEQRSRNRHMERQKKARKLREEEKRNNFLSNEKYVATNPHFSVGQQVYQSMKEKKISAEKMLLVKEEKRRTKRAEEKETLRKEARRLAASGGVYATVMNHTTNKEHTYSSSAALGVEEEEEGEEGEEMEMEGEEMREEEEEMEMDSKMRASELVEEGEERRRVQRVGRAYTAHEKNLFSVLKRDGKKGSNSKSKSKSNSGLCRDHQEEKGSPLKASDLFDANSPYHPQNSSRDQSSLSSLLSSSKPSMGRSSVAVGEAGRRTIINTTSNNGGERETKRNDWSLIFNGSGTKRRAMVEKRSLVSEEEKESTREQRARMGKQRSIMHVLSSTHMEAIVSRSNVDMGVVRSHLLEEVEGEEEEGKNEEGCHRSRSRKKKTPIKLENFHPSVRTPLGGLFKRATKTEQNLRDVLSMLRS